MSFYFKSGTLSLVLGLTAVMVIYWVGIGSYDSTVCREQYHSVERLGYGCRLLGFPTHMSRTMPGVITLTFIHWTFC